MNLTTTPIPFDIITSKSSKSDQNFIEFTRCLYKAKIIVQELEQFSRTIGPSLYISSFKEEISTNEIIKSINQYLNQSFQKFNQMCKVLLLVLEKLESDYPKTKERILSYRADLLNEWEKALLIKENLILFIHQTEQEEEELLTISDSSSTSSVSSI